MLQQKLTCGEYFRKLQLPSYNCINLSSMPSFCTSPPPTPPPLRDTPHKPSAATPAQPTCSSLTVKPITQHNPPNHSAAFVNTNVIKCASKSPKSQNLSSLTAQVLSFSTDILITSAAVNRGDVLKVFRQILWMNCFSVTANLASCSEATKHSLKTSLKSSSVTLMSV